MYSIEERTRVFDYIVLDSDDHILDALDPPKRIV